MWNREEAERLVNDVSRYRLNLRLKRGTCDHPGDGTTRTLLQLSHPDDGAIWAVRCHVCERSWLECGMPRERRR